MVSQFQKFKDLHSQNDPLLLGNAWNVQSATLLEKVGYQAIGTSSAAIAETLGYADGQMMSFEEYFYIIQRIIKNVNIPLTVDLESGYGDNTDSIVDNIIKLSNTGVAGINIEDSYIEDSIRKLDNAASFEKKLNAIIQALSRKGIDIFINVRCDAFLLSIPNQLEEGLNRIKLYESTGINGIFLPGISNETEISRIVASTMLPLNVMCWPNLPGFNTLKDLGVKRISMGNFVNTYIYKRMEEICTNFKEEGSFPQMV